MEDLVDTKVDEVKKSGIDYTKLAETGKKLATKLLASLSFFTSVYLVAWTINAIYPNIRFDLTSLRDFYLMVVGKQTVEHGINSLLNSARDKMPNKDD